MVNADRMGELLKQACPVMPVLVVEDPDHGIPLATALVSGGLPVLEVTLRTDRAFEVIEKMLQVPGAIVGAGTVTSPDQLSRLGQMGAHFAVSPGSTPAMLAAGKASSIPLLPAVATASEIMLGLEYGYGCFKLFPAAVAGGVAALKAFAGPFSAIRFCPTGGIDQNNGADYLALDNVTCVGGSWVAPKPLIAAQDWTAIEQLAEEARMMMTTP